MTDAPPSVELIDVLLAVTLLVLAWRAITSSDLFTSIVLFISFGLSMALVWVRLQATDIALAEAAIGAGLTGALFLSALARFERPRPELPADQHEDSH